VSDRSHLWQYPPSYLSETVSEFVSPQMLTRQKKSWVDSGYDYGTVATENRLSKCSGRPLGLCGRRLPELNLIPIQVIDPGKATVGFIHSFGVNLYSLLF